MKWYLGGEGGVLGTLRRRWHRGLGVFAVAASSLMAAHAETVRVMTFNLWHGGDAGRQPLSQTLEVIRSAKADLVGLQETQGYAKDGQPPRDAARALAGMLGWQYFDQGAAGYCRPARQPTHDAVDRHAGSATLTPGDDSPVPGESSPASECHCGVDRSRLRPSSTG